jgi:hypothetical protein
MFEISMARVNFTLQLAFAHARKLRSLFNLVRLHILLNMNDVPHHIFLGKTVHDDDESGRQLASRFRFGKKRAS